MGFWYSVPMTTSRMAQKEKTRRKLIDSALALSAKKSFSALSLREVATGAGITPAGFYRHFQNLEELGLVLMDEVGVSLRQLLRQTRRERVPMPRPKAIALSVQAYLTYIRENRSLFQLLLGERMGGSPNFRKALHKELELFKDELAADLVELQKQYGPPLKNPRLTAEAITSIFFVVGAEALDLEKKGLKNLEERLNAEILMVFEGSPTE